MKKSSKLILFHNPSAGDAAHDKELILEELNEEGFNVQYFSTKKDWKNADVSKADLIVIAGGDGTVRKVAGWMLENKLLKNRIPVTILPLGTANNLSKTLLINGEYPELIKQWKSWTLQAYDIGRIKDDQGKPGKLYFMEAIGCGLFTEHLHKAAELKGHTENKDNPEKKIQADLERLLVTLKHMRPVEALIEIDGQKIHDSFLLVEVMNSMHIGTNLGFNPGNIPGDRKFNVIMVNANEREILEEFIRDKINGIKNETVFTTVAGNDISLNCESHLYHLDDVLCSTGGGGALNVSANVNQLFFLVPSSQK